MKKIFMTIALLFMCILSFGQLNTMSVEDYAGYKTVYKLPMAYGEIRWLPNEGFIYFGVTDNKFEKTMASIYLGETNESALATLNDLKNLKETLGKNPIIVRGANNKHTQIFKDGFGQLVFKTDGVAGFSYALSYYKWFDKAIDAVKNFTIPEE